MTKLERVLKFMNTKKNYTFTWKKFQESFPGYPTTETNYLSMLVKAQYVMRVGRGSYHVAILPARGMTYAQLESESKANWNTAKEIKQQYFDAFPGLKQLTQTKKKNKADKFCVHCLKSTRLLVHCGKFTQKRG